MQYLNLPFGIRVSNSDPLDGDRYIAADVAARDLIVTNDRGHNGLLCYVQSEKNLYILDDVSTNTWKLLASDLSTLIDYIDGSLGLRDTSIAYIVENFVPNASLGSSFYWNVGYLDASVALSTLTDTSFGIPSDKQTIIWNASLGYWELADTTDASSLFVLRVDFDSSILYIHNNFVPNVSVGTSATHTVYWNAGYLEASTGVQGIQGITGAQGTEGAQGIQGITGAQGIQGTQGITGAQGIQGTQGITGTQGVQGIQGITGAQGVQGIQGITGAQGVQGIQGTQGVQGIQGISFSDASLNLYVLKAGDSMSGRLYIDASLHTTRDTYFGDTSTRQHNFNGDLHVTGNLTATTKSFLIEHPSKDTGWLQYSSLEGPEFGVYVRGKYDSEEIKLPYYWKDLVDDKSITVNLTSINKWQVPYVKEVNIDYVKIGKIGFGKIEGYYVIFAERKDIKKLKIER